MDNTIAKIRNIKHRISLGLPCKNPFTLEVVDCGELLKQLVGEEVEVTIPTSVNSLKLHSSYRICKSCENYQADTDKCRLGSCGCFLHSWATRATSRCPLGKFDNLEEYMQHQREEFYYR